MQAMIISWLSKWLLTLLLDKATAALAIDKVQEANQTFVNNMSKKGFVYRALKEATNDKTPQSLLNLAVELGVLIVKRGK